MPGLQIRPWNGKPCDGGDVTRLDRLQLLISTLMIHYRGLKNATSH